MRLPVGYPRGPVAPMHHLEVKLEEEAIHTTVPERSFSLPEDAMNTSALLLKAIYAICWLYHIDFHMIIEEQEFKDGEAFAAPAYLGLANPPYNFMFV